MPIRKYKPTTPGRRGASVNYDPSLTKEKPYKKLTSGISKKW